MQSRMQVGFAHRLRSLRDESEIAARGRIHRTASQNALPRCERTTFRPSGPGLSMRTYLSEGLTAGLLQETLQRHRRLHSRAYDDGVPPVVDVRPTFEQVAWGAEHIVARRHTLGKDPLPRCVRLAHQDAVGAHCDGDMTPLAHARHRILGKNPALDRPP